MNSKPSSCEGCPLQTLSRGFAKPDGPEDANLLIVGEALGYNEAEAGRPFVGAAGYFLDTTLRRAGYNRELCRVHNVVSCQPPANELVQRPWTVGAIGQCSEAHLAPELDRKSWKVILTLGVTATRAVLKHYGVVYSGSLDNWHGYVIGEGGPWIVPTYHPSFIIQRNKRYTQVFTVDVKKAVQIAKEGFTRQPVRLLQDPSPQEFAFWADGLPDDGWLVVDIETPKGDDSLPPSKDPSYTILRMNFSYSEWEGVSVPNLRAYRSSIERVLASPATKVVWNQKFDVPRLLYNHFELGGEVFDTMEAWHFLQTDLGSDDDKSGKGGATVKGNSLGFVTPFYSDLPPWKHLMEEDEAYYGALDGIQTFRATMGTIKNLVAGDQWYYFNRHCLEFRKKCLDVAEAAGLLIDFEALDAYEKVVNARYDDLGKQIAAMVPEEVLPLLPAKGWKKDPGDKHPGSFSKETSEGLRWFVRGEFNPESPTQIAAYITFKGLKTKKSKHSKSGKPSTDKYNLEILAKKDPTFKRFLERRDVAKTKGTYIKGIRTRVREDGRVHTNFTFRPSMHRLSSTDPNMQNVTHGDAGEDLTAEPWSAKGFKRCIVAAPGHKLIEADSSAIEAVIVGWFARDPFYIKVSKMGIHSYLVALKEHDAPSPDEVKLMSDAQMSALGKHLKKYKKHPLRDKKKRTVHGAAYGMRAPHLAQTYPELYPRGVPEAQSDLDEYFSICPSVLVWQNDCRELAHKRCFLGGADHPFYHKHYFYDVKSYDWNKQSYAEGADWNRVVSYYPQSTAAGVQREFGLTLAETPFIKYLRLFVHDSIVLEVPDAEVSVAVAELRKIMTMQIKELPMPEEWGLGPFLNFGVEVKVGQNWMEMEEVS